MTEESRFHSIREKLQQLLKQHLRLKKENAQLKQELERCQQTEQAHLQRIGELKQQVDVLKLAAGTMNEKDKKEFEKKLNQYIKDIDKCIDFLSK